MIVFGCDPTGRSASTPAHYTDITIAPRIHHRRKDHCCRHKHHPSSTLHCSSPPPRQSNSKTAVERSDLLKVETATEASRSLLRIPSSEICELGDPANTHDRSISRIADLLHRSYVSNLHHPRRRSRPASTRQVILDDGELREYAKPVKAVQVLRKEGSAWFLCDADEMDFNGFVSAVDGADNHFPGQLYFVLPASMLRKPLQGEHIAALAAKASAALMHSVPTGRSRSGRQSTLIFPEPSSAPTPVTRKRSSGKGRRNFAVSLGAIPE